MKKAILLSAGFGTRLRPITLTTPKCLVEIHGKPLLNWWFDLLEMHGFEEVLINTHYLSEKVDAFILHDYKGNLKVTIAYEPVLLGSAGTIRNNRSFYENEDDFTIIYADNLSDINLSKMRDFHKENHACFTMGMFHTNRPKECGICAVDENKTVIEFVEKPSEPKSDLANAGIYMVNKNCYDLFDEDSFDIGKEILPRLVGKMKGYAVEDYLLDIGSLENLEKARREWQCDDHFENTAAD